MRFISSLFLIHFSLLKFYVQIIILIYRKKLNSFQFFVVHLVLCSFVATYFYVVKVLRHRVIIMSDPIKIAKQACLKLPIIIMKAEFTAKKIEKKLKFRYAAYHPFCNEIRKNEIFRQPIKIVAMIILMSLSGSRNWMDQT